MNREEYLATLHPLFQQADVALRQYVALIQKSPELEDDAIEKQLIADGCEWSMAQSTVLFVPLAFGRVVVDRFGVKVAETYIHHDLATGEEREFDLSTDVAFTWAKAVVDEYATAPEFKDAFQNIATRGAEVNAINNALEKGVPKEELCKSTFRPTTVCLGRRTKRSWWRSLWSGVK